MKNTLQKQVRGTWSKEENALLIELAHEKDYKGWNLIATQINEKCGGTKTGKQCRERFRNYANPVLEKSEWKPHEKALFIVLHQVYGNKWSIISHFLNQRSYVAIKNYFYSVIRKAIKCTKRNIVPEGFIKKPEKFYMIFSTLNCILKDYLPSLARNDPLSNGSGKEQVVLNILKERGITNDCIINYQKLMINTFKEKYNLNNLPVEVSFTLKSFNFPSNKAKELIMSQHLYNISPLNNLVRLKILEDEKKESSSSPCPSPVVSKELSKGEVRSDQCGSLNNPSYRTFLCPVPACYPMPYGSGIQPYPPFQMYPPMPYQFLDPNQLGLYPQHGLYYGGSCIPPPYLPLIQPQHSGSVNPASSAKAPIIQVPVTSKHQRSQPAFKIEKIQGLEPANKTKIYSGSLYKMQ